VLLGFEPSLSTHTLKLTRAQHLSGYLVEQ